MEKKPHKNGILLFLSFFIFTALSLFLFFAPPTMTVTPLQYLQAMLATVHSHAHCATVSAGIAAGYALSNDHVLLLCSASACATCLETCSTRLPDFITVKLCGAAQSGKLPLAVECLRAGANVNQVIVSGTMQNRAPPLCFSGSRAMALFLLQAGARPDVSVRIGGESVPLLEANPRVKDALSM
jgi:hypothetical protein